MTEAIDRDNEPVPRVAVIGCGYWGRNHVRTFAELGALAAVVDPDEAAATRLAAQFGSVSRNLDDVLADPAIDGVTIAAPAALHAELVASALEADKDVLVEKPLSLDVTSAERLCAVARQRGRILMVGHLLQYHPAFLKLKSLVSEGALGRINYAYSNRLNLGKIRREENILWSFAPHDLSMIMSILAEEPDQVLATGGAFLNKDVADVTTTHLSFPSGRKAHIFVSWLHPFKEQKLVVVGDRQMAVFDDGQPWDRKLLLYPHTIEWTESGFVPNKADARAVAIEHDEPLKLECAHFLERIIDRASPRTDGEEGLAVLRVLDAAERSIESGRPVDTRARSDRRDGVRIHESAYIDEPSTIGPGTRIWHFSHVLPNTRIGANCTIGQNVVIGPDVQIGDNCKIQNNVSVYKGVTLEDGVFCGPSCVFTNVLNPRAEIERKSEFRETLVGRGATIGANATIVCGHALGRYCLIAAGAVVTSDVPDFALMAGVPARRVGWVSHSGRRLDDRLVCPETGRKYREVGKDRLEEIAQ